jgi:hypothetical protein
MQTAPTTGSLISATMRPEDLIPTFLEEAYSLMQTDGEAKDLGAIRKRMKSPNYYDTEDATFDLEQLFDLLNEAAPEGFYFGSHPGDGSDYGFWEDDSPGIDNDEEPETPPEG